MHYVTTYLDPNEPCDAISERPMMREMPDGSHQWRWVQQVFVYRDDTIAKYETDMGPAEDFERITPLALLSLGEDNVAHMQWFADKNRHDTYWQDYVKELQESSTLHADIIRQNEQMREAIKNKSSIGPYQKTQRDGFSRQTSERRIMERKQRVF